MALMVLTQMAPTHLMALLVTPPLMEVLLAPTPEEVLVERLELTPVLMVVKPQTPVVMAAAVVAAVCGLIRLTGKV